MKSNLLENLDILERMSRWATLAALAIAVVFSITTPLMALSWARNPFPGFLVEQTLVVNGIEGEGWTGKESGIEYPQQVIRIAGVEIKTTSEFYAVLRNHEVGEQVAIFTRNQNGSIQLFPAVTLMQYPIGNMVRDFWVLYLIGLVYLGIGIWVYLVRGKSRPGRVLAFFCATTSLGTILIFDLSSTHVAVLVWISAVALAAGSLVSLGMRFPLEWHIVKRHPWVLVLPYFISFLLSIWGLLTAYNLKNPWAYISNWEITYRFAAASILFFLGMIVYHAVSNTSFRIRQQSRIVLLGSAVAFLPVAFMFIASRSIGFHVLLLAFLPAFPIAVAVAVMRYNLWKVDALVNQAIVFGVLTTLVAGLFTALGKYLVKIFMAITGQNSDVALLITAFFVALTVRPVQKIIDQFVHKRLGNSPNNTKELESFGEQVRSHLFLNDPDQITSRLLDQVASSLNAESCAVIANHNGHYEITHVYGPWRGNSVASIPLITQNRHYGTLFIGPNKSGVPYNPADFKTLQEVTEQVTKAIHLSTRMSLYPTEKEKLGTEKTAFIQQYRRNNGKPTE